MSKDVVCNYCCEEEWWENKRINIYDDMELFEYDFDNYANVGTYVRINNGNEMTTHSVIAHKRQFVSASAEFKINFCPMCGRKLKESEGDSECS